MPERGVYVRLCEPASKRRPQERCQAVEQSSWINRDMGKRAAAPRTASFRVADALSEKRDVMSARGRLWRAGLDSGWGLLDIPFGYPPDLAPACPSTPPPRFNLRQRRRIRKGILWDCYFFTALMAARMCGGSLDASNCANRCPASVRLPSSVRPFNSVINAEMCASAI